MRIQHEKSGDSKDFGRRETLRIEAFTPDDCFKLGVLCQKLVNSNAEFVHGHTPNNAGVFLRFPLETDDGLRQE